VASQKTGFGTGHTKILNNFLEIYKSITVKQLFGTLILMTVKNKLIKTYRSMKAV